MRSSAQAVIYLEDALVRDRYQLGRCLYSGKFSAVHLAQDLQYPGRLVAIKLLSPHVPQHSNEYMRFRQEMMVASSINHPNVIRTYESIEDKWSLGIVMEYADGGDLSQYICEKSKLPVKDVLYLVHQIAFGLSAIHSAGIVHLDLKPENVLLSSKGQAKISDFGISCVNAATMLRGREDDVVGTIDYMCPELIEEGEFSFNSDLYSLGVLSYEMLTGTCPFRGVSVLERLKNHLAGEPVKPSSLVPTIPTAFEEIILRAMAREPKARYQSAADLIHDLELLFKEI